MFFRKFQGIFNRMVGSGSLSSSMAGRGSATVLCALVFGSFVHGASAQSNTFYGTTAGASITTGTNDSGFGAATLFLNSTGSDNTAMGYRALVFNTTGTDNTATGSNALGAGASVPMEGSLNTATGSHSLYSLTSGGRNTASGFNALHNNTTGGYNTASGVYALENNVSGGDNTAIGSFSLRANTSSYNTAIGDSSLQGNTTGSSNTAAGYTALLSNTTGLNNTAVGTSTLYHNTTASGNTATGASALAYNTTGASNTAQGFQALLNNTTASFNSALGMNALYSNKTGIYNTAVGANALLRNATSYNTAVGLNALYSDTTGAFNTGQGALALFRNTTGSSNIALGYGAGQNLTTGSSNIEIGNAGVAAETRTTRIGSTQIRAFVAGVRGAVVGGGVAVYVSASGQLGTNPSSRRFKQDIANMDQQSEAVLALRPVSFRYKEEFDPTKTAQFGLIAEEVAEIDPDLVARDDKGEIYSVRYEAVNAMLLNEFLKEHIQLVELKAAVTQQQKEIVVLTAALKTATAQIEKVSAQITLQKPATPIVAASE